MLSSREPTAPLLTTFEAHCGVLLGMASFTIDITRALGGFPQREPRQDGDRKLNATKADVIEFLRRRSALIVHFASAPRLAGTGLRYPASLLGVISDPSLELSSSVVQPGDRFGMGATPRNATGMIGLILSPRSDASVISIDASDAGSYVGKGGRRHFIPRSFDVHALEESMEARGQAAGPEAAYNEWGMRDYEIVGLFVADCADNEVMYANAVEHDYERFENTMEHFCQASFRVFTFQAGSIVELVDGNVRPVGHAELYV